MTGCALSGLNCVQENCGTSQLTAAHFARPLRAPVAFFTMHVCTQQKKLDGWTSKVHSSGG